MEPIVKVGTPPSESAPVARSCSDLAGVLGRRRDIWDSWIIAALVLWVLAAAAGSRTGAEYTAGMKKAESSRLPARLARMPELLAINRTQRGVVLHAVASASMLLILIDMIWKPGA